MSVATAASADETCCAEQRDGAWGWDAVGYQIGHGESVARVAIVLGKHKVHVTLAVERAGQLSSGERERPAG